MLRSGRASLLPPLAAGRGLRYRRHLFTQGYWSGPVLPVPRGSTLNTARPSRYGARHGVPEAGRAFGMTSPDCGVVGERGFRSSQRSGGSRVRSVRDVRGRMQRASCSRFLGALEAAGHSRRRRVRAAFDLRGALRSRRLRRGTRPRKASVRGAGVDAGGRPSLGHDAGEEARRRSVGGLSVALQGRRMAGWGLSGERRRRTGSGAAAAGTMREGTRIGGPVYVVSRPGCCATNSPRMRCAARSAG